MKKFKKIHNKDKKYLLDNIKNRPLKINKNKNFIKNDTKNIKNIFNNKSKQILLFIIIIQFIINIYLFIKQRIYQSNDFNNDINNDDEIIENINTNILSRIQDKLRNYIEIRRVEQKFLNGIIRKYKPKKISRNRCFIWRNCSFNVECNKGFKRF